MTYAINLNECKSVGMHWIALYVNDNNAIYFHSFGVEHIPKKKSKKFYETKKSKQVLI